jgi:hypothetical protein
MPGYEIQPIDERNYPEVVPFLLRWVREASGNAEQTAPDVDPSRYAQDFRWMLDLGNPAHHDSIPSGHILRNDQGTVVGMIGHSPGFFLLGDRRYRGLGGSNFYVDQSARLQGFFMFKKYLGFAATDFCFSTTCNDNSGPLWTKCGAGPVPGGNAEYILVMKSGPVLQDLALNRRIPRPFAAALRPVGSILDLVILARKSRSPLTVEWCQDWDKLHAIAGRNRDPARLTPERSPADLFQRYEGMIKQLRPLGQLDGVYRFSDRSGNEGWFTVREAARGRLKQIRGVSLADLVWPHGSIELADILCAILELISPRADVFSVRDRFALGLRPGLLGFRRRALPVQDSFVITRAASALPPSAELAKTIDLPPSYGA